MADAVDPQLSDPQPATGRDSTRMWDIMEAQRIAFLVTLSSMGPHARPMSPIVRRDDGLIWFLTDSATTKDWEIEQDHRCALLFTDGGSTHLAITGSAEIVDDRPMTRSLWSTAAQAFYPGGPEDPAIVAIRVEPLVAELWDGPSAPIALVRMAAALVTGRSAADMGQNVKGALSPDP